MLSSTRSLSLTSSQVPLWYPVSRRTRTKCTTLLARRPGVHPRSFHTTPLSASPANDTYTDESTIPKYYRERKGRRDEDVMEHLSDSAFSDEIAASTRRMASKIPFEFFNEQGQLVHPSGYVPPSPGDAPHRRERQRDLALQTAAVAERVLEEDFTDVEAALRTRKAKVPFEFQHEDGSTSHPSGYIPPTPAYLFGTYQPPSNPHVPMSVKPKPLVNPLSKETDPRPQDEGEKAKQLADVDKRKEEESVLMKELVSGVLSRGVSASTEPKEEKVPNVIVSKDGQEETAQHPKGFVPPSIGKEAEH